MMKRKIITALLVLCMLLALAPITVKAGMLPPWINSLSVDPTRCAAGAEVMLRVWNAEPEGTDWQNEEYYIVNPGTTNATLTLDGMFLATSPGTAIVKVVVFDLGREDDFEQEVAITVFEPITITTQSLPNGQVGVPYIADLTATGSPKYWDWDSTELPPGLDLVDKRETAVITGTPTKSGTYNIYVEASNNFTDAGAYFTIEIAQAAPDPTPTPAPPTGTDATETDVTETDATETDATETDVTETDATETDVTETDATETDATETDVTETDPTGTNPTETDSTKTDPSKNDPSQTDQTGTAPTGTNPTGTNPGNTSPTGTASSRTEPSGTDSTKTDPGEAETINLIQESPEWTKGSDKPASFTSNAEFKDFLYVRVDGEIVDEANYDVKEGSTIVTFKVSYLERLSVGKHTVEIVSASGSGQGTISAHGIIDIKAQADQEKLQVTTSNISTTESGNSTPKTGENSGHYQWLTLILLSAGGIIFLIRKKRISQETDK